MKARFCIIGATRGTGLLIAQQLLQGGSNVTVVVRLGGALTVVVIGAFLVRAWRRALRGSYLIRGITAATS